MLQRNVYKLYKLGAIQFPQRNRATFSNMEMQDMRIIFDILRWYEYENATVGEIKRWQNYFDGIWKFWVGSTCPSFLELSDEKNHASCARRDRRTDGQMDRWTDEIKWSFFVTLGFFMYNFEFSCQYVCNSNVLWSLYFVSMCIICACIHFTFVTFWNFQIVIPTKN